MSRKVGDQVVTTLSFADSGTAPCREPSFTSSGLEFTRSFAREREREERMIHPDRCAKGEEQFIGSLKSRGARDRERIVVA